MTYALRTSDAIVRLSDAEADRLIDQLVSDVQQYPAVGRVKSSVAALAEDTNAITRQRGAD